MKFDVQEIHMNATADVALGTKDDFRQNEASVMVNSRPTGKSYRVRWKGSNVPKGAIIEGFEIAWTQNGVVHSNGKIIGRYERIVDDPHNGSEMIITLFYAVPQKLTASSKSHRIIQLLQRMIDDCSHQKNMEDIDTTSQYARAEVLSQYKMFIHVSNRPKETIYDILAQCHSYAQWREGTTQSPMTKELLVMWKSELGADNYEHDGLIENQSSLSNIIKERYDLDGYKRLVNLQGTIGNTPFVLTLSGSVQGTESTVDSLVDDLRSRVVCSEPCTLYGVEYPSLTMYEIIQQTNILCIENGSDIVYMLDVEVLENNHVAVSLMN